MNSISDDVLKSILELLSKQLTKDLNSAFSTEPLVLAEELIQYCEVLSRSGYSELSQRLYSVDIDEDSLYFQLQENKDASEALLIARLVLKRELQKILFRIAFKDIRLDDCVNRILPS